MWDAFLDLVLGSRCAACSRPGRALCVGCEADLPRGGAEARPTPCPPGLVLPMAAGPYDGVLRLLVNAHKEQRVLALARPLGEVLASVVADLVPTGATRPGETWLLVPVPSRPGVVRRRGHDPVLRMTRRAAGVLRSTGSAVSVARLLSPGRAVVDQAGLDAAHRAVNLAGALQAVRAPAQAPPALVVDDVLTTGATAREAQRALETAGWPVHGVAVVAATRRRLLTGQGGSLPLSDGGD